MQSSSLVLFLGLAFTVLANPGCPPRDPSMLTVHLVCHTHDDVGWLKTVDQYFYGANNTIQRAGVQYILDTVVEQLSQDPTRMFSYVETAFFYRWWHEQTQDVQQKVKDLVASGQLELLNGGWCMNDEAAAHYTAIIDQMTTGLVFLNQTFGPSSRPQVAWQIDPFGHSNAQAELLAQMGFDGLFFGRLDFADKQRRWLSKELEMVWQSSLSLGEDGWLFTGVLPNGYGPPDGFCFDDLCGDTPIMDDVRLHDHNVDQKVNDFLAAVQEQAKAYRSNNIIMTMGSDFHYQNARTWYKNLDKLIKYVNARQSSGSNVSVVYSTPSCYLDAVHSDGLSWKTKQDDFFPYASDHHSYWTGYYTSRPALKRYIRVANSYLQVAKQIAALTNSLRSPALEHMSQTLGVVQHHDAVSGTAKQHVTDDYTMRISASTKELVDSLQYGARGAAGATAADDYSLCPNANISACSFTETQTTFEVVVYNPLAWPVSKYVRIPVPDNASYKVTDYQGSSVPTQLVPIPSSVVNIPYRESNATHELVFLASSVPPLGTVVYSVSKTANMRLWRQQSSRVLHVKPGHDTTVFHGPMSVVIDGKTGHLKSITLATKSGPKTQTVEAKVMWYAAMSGNNSEDSFRASGAYIFRPNGTDANIMGAPNNIIYEGDLVLEIHQQWSPWSSLAIRLYKGKNHAEVEWLAGPIPIAEDVGKEVIVRYILRDAQTNATFYTDANGREMQKRIKDHRNTWQLNVTEPVAGNYYPVTSCIMINSVNKGSFAVLNDRAQGGTSLHDGEVELMVHRRLLHDDAFGVGEALNETAYGEGLIVRGTHYLLFSDFATDACDFSCQIRSLSKEVFMDSILKYQTSSGQTLPPPWSGLTAALPPQVHLLTLEPWYGAGEMLIRLEHIFASNESSLSVPVTVNLTNLLANIVITAATETTLSANQWLSDSQRLQWTVDNSTQHSTASDDLHLLENVLEYRQYVKERHSKYRYLSEQDLSVTLNPMQIRTFIATGAQRTT